MRALVLSAGVTQYTQHYWYQNASWWMHSVCVCVCVVHCVCPCSAPCFITKTWSTGGFPCNVLPVVVRWSDLGVTQRCKRQHKRPGIYPTQVSCFTPRMHNVTVVLMNNEYSALYLSPVALQPSRFLSAWRNNSVILSSARARSS